MPILKNAKKALRRDKRRTIVNLKVRNRMKEAVKEAKDSKDASKLPAAYQAVDRAVKQKLIHKNKAARVKSQLAKTTNPNAVKPVAAKKAVAKKTTAKKVAPKKAAAKKTVAKKTTAKKASK